MQQIIVVPIKLETIRQTPQAGNTLAKPWTPFTYLYEYEDPCFMVEGLGELRVSDLIIECDDRSCWYVHKPTQEAVNVSLSYEKVADALKRKATP